MKKLVLLLGIFAIISEGFSQELNNVTKKEDVSSVNNGKSIPLDKLKEVNLIGISCYDTVNYCTYNKADFWLTQSYGFTYKMAIRTKKDFKIVEIIVKEPTKHITFLAFILILLGIAFLIAFLIVSLSKLGKNNEKSRRPRVEDDCYHIGTIQNNKNTTRPKNDYDDPGSPATNRY
ncbi:MAG: hypothetical protein ACOYMB_00835 [Patescibacteria group bacterium]